MSDSPHPQDLYEYDGWLVFNELFTTEVFGGEDMDAGNVVDNFPDYEGGIPKDADSGFNTTDFPGHLQTIGQLSDDLYNYAENLFAFEFIDEDWVQHWGYNAEGEEEMYYLPNHDQVDIFWDTAGSVMMFRGDKQLLAQKRKALRGDLTGSLKLNSVTFDFDFFLWVLYKKYKGDQLNASLRVRNLTRGKTIGEKKDNLGREISVTGTRNVLKSVMLIAPLLDGKKLHSIQGDFIIGDRNQIKAEIHHEGKVHVKVTDSPLSGLNDLRRMGFSVWFLSELVNLYTYWDELDPTERYPPESFFDDLADNAEQEGWDLQFDPIEVKQEYARKRQGTESNGTGDSSSPVGQE